MTAEDLDTQTDPPADVQAPVTDTDDEATSAATTETTETAGIIGPRDYGHVSRAILERPWALQPAMLNLIAGVVRGRMETGKPSDAEIAAKIEAARSQGGDRSGGANVGGVAVIPMYGPISQRMSLMSDMSGGCSIDGLRQTLRQALADPAVSAVVFDIDSPGGSVDGITEFAAELRSLRGGPKPIVGQVNTLCASAAYWAAANMTEIVCTPSGEVGSVGVFAVHEDYSKADEMAGVKTTLISAGKYKTEGNDSEPLSDDARAAIQDQVDSFYSMFVGDVAKGRKVGVDAVTANYGQGRTLLAKAALAAGMVDRVDTLDATVARFQPKAVATGRRSAQMQSPAQAASGSGVQPDRAWNRRMKGRIR